MLVENPMEPEDLAKLVVTVRVLASDDTEPYDYTDEQIIALLEATEYNTFITAAMLLERTAATLSVRYISVRTDDLAVDGKAAVSTLLALAKALRDRADADEIDAFEVVSPFGNEPIRPEGTARWVF